MILDNKRKIIVLALLSLSLYGCGRNTTTYTHQLGQIAKDAASDTDFKNSYSKYITRDAYEKLVDELNYMESSNNITTQINYSGASYNSLNKAFYDMNVTGNIGSKTGNAELFLFIDDSGKITDVGAWWKTLE